MEVEITGKKLIENMWICLKGWRCWRRLVRSYRVKAEDIVILLLDDKECNEFALLYLDAYLKQKMKKRAFIVTANVDEARKTVKCSNQVTAIKELARKEIDDLLQYYLLLNFDERFIVASIDKPWGRDGTKLVGINGLTKEEVFCIGVYKLYPFKKQNKRRETEK